MFFKKASAAEIGAAREKVSEAFGEVEYIEDVPVKEYMLKWLSAFAPDMTVYDAKSFCLPKLLYKNYLWHAFSFQKTDCYMAEDAAEAYGEGFDGPVFVLLNGENILFKLADGKKLGPSAVGGFNNIIVFKEDFSETYVNTGSEEFGPYYKSADMAASDDDGSEDTKEL